MTDEIIKSFIETTSLKIIAEINNGISNMINENILNKIEVNKIPLMIMANTICYVHEMMINQPSTIEERIKFIDIICKCAKYAISKEHTNC